MYNEFQKDFLVKFLCVTEPRVILECPVLFLGGKYGYNSE